MRKLTWIIFILIFLFGIFDFVLAQEKKVEIKFFYSPTCSHCAQEWKFLDGLQERYPDVKINRFSVSKRNNVGLLKEFYDNYNVPAEYQGMVPITFTNNRYFVGFNEEIGRDIEGCILECKKGSVSKSNVTVIDLEGNINIPFIGKLNIKKYSFPVLTVLLGTLDGFNVCSLGALILILGLALAIGSRKKTLLFGGIFILATAVVYGFLILIWYQIFSYLIPYMRVMEIVIGLLGIGGAIYFFSQFIKFRKQGPTCEITPGKNIMSKFSLKFQQSLQGSGGIILLLANVLLFAAIITIVEFPCSAMVPVAFAGILAQARLPALFYLLYITLYLIFYLLDEIIVFLIAFFTMKVWLTSSKITTWITLTEALILFILGFYYLLGFGAFL